MSTFQQFNINPVLTPVRVVATTNQAGTYNNGESNNGVGATLTYATGALSIDSVVIEVGNRILLIGQTNANENGVYVCTQAGATGVSAILQRAADQQSLEQFHPGQYVTVGAGTVNKGAAFVMTEPVPAQLGVSNLVWTASPLNTALGTAAAKNVSDNSKATVASINGPTLANTIAVFTDTTGTIDDTTFLAIHDGDLAAGRSGTPGTISSFPPTIARGSFKLAAADNSGDFLVALSNASHGQATVYSIPDVGAATGQILNKTAALVSGNVIAASGTAGVVVDAGAPATGLMQVASVSISAAEFNGMYAAPKLLIAAPGANNLIVVHRMLLVMTFVSADFANGGVVAAQYDSTVHGAGVLATNSEAAADFFAAASTTFAFNGTSGNTVGILPFSTTVNKGLYLSNATGAFTTGDSTFVAKIYYRIIAVA